MLGKLSNRNALEFLLAGNCEVTVVSHRTDRRITYKLIKKESNFTQDENIYFLYVNVDRTQNYAGFIVSEEKTQGTDAKFRFIRGARGNYDCESTEVIAMLYILNNLSAGIYDIGVDIYHCGKCGKCGKKLTSPESIKIGLGPKCSGSRNRIKKKKYEDTPIFSL